MNSFCGIFFKDGTQAGFSETEIMLSSFRESFPAGKVRKACFALGVARYSLSGASGPLPLYYEDDNFLAAFSGRIHNLPGENTGAKPERTYGNIIDTLQKDPAGIRGDFVAVLFNVKTKTLSLFRDQLGTRPLYYTENNKYLVFSTEINPIRVLPGTAFPLDEQWIADSISTVKSEKWRTPFSGIRRLCPGHILLVSGVSEERKYWDLYPDRAGTTYSYEEAVDKFRILFKTALERRMPESLMTGSELSGGLDSSGVTAFAYEIAREKDVPFFALSHGFKTNIPVPYFPFKDEREYSHEVVRYLGLNNFITCDAGRPGLLEKLQLAFRIQSGPVQQVFSSFSDGLYSVAKDLGVHGLLSGFGGDEGVSSRAGGFFDELVSRGDWNTFRDEYFSYSEHKGNNRFITQAKYAYKRYLQARTAYKRLPSYPGWKMAKFSALGFDREFGERIKIRERFFGQKGLPEKAGVQEFQYSRIMADHISQRMEYSWFDARYFGIEYAYPLLDVDLLEFYFSLPSVYKFRNGWDRAIFRDALKDMIPEKIRLRGATPVMTIPSLHKRVLDDLEEIGKLISESKKYNRVHYLDYEEMLRWKERIRNRSFSEKTPSNGAAFINSVQILLLQKMEREGSFSSGILY